MLYVSLLSFDLQDGLEAALPDEVLVYDASFLILVGDPALGSRVKVPVFDET